MDVNDLLNPVAPADNAASASPTPPLTSTPTPGTANTGASASTTAPTTLTSTPEPEPPLTYPISYFIYGSLQHEAFLAHILRTDQYPAGHPSSARPIPMFPGRITGWRIKFWADCPALVPAETPEAVVDGWVISIYDKHQEQRLQAHQTEHYRVQVLDIVVKFGESGLDAEEGVVVHGKAFVWAGDEGQLREGE